MNQLGAAERKAMEFHLRNNMKVFVCTFCTREIGYQGKYDRTRDIYCSITCMQGSRDLKLVQDRVRYQPYFVPGNHSPPVECHFKVMSQSEIQALKHEQLHRPD